MNRTRRNDGEGIVTPLRASAIDDRELCKSGFRKNIRRGGKNTLNRRCFSTLLRGWSFISIPELVLISEGGANITQMVKEMGRCRRKSRGPSGWIVAWLRFLFFFFGNIPGMDIGGTGRLFFCTCLCLILYDHFFPRTKNTTSGRAMLIHDLDEGR